MNSKVLTTSALLGLPVPRVPVGPLAVHFCAGVAGCSSSQYTTDARALAESIIRYYECFHPDTIWVSADTWVSAEAMGARVGTTGDNQPFGGIGAPLVQTIADLDRIPAVDVDTQGRYPLMLEALARVVQVLGKDVFIVACFDQYPFSLAAALMGINEIMLKVYDDPAFVQALMVRCSEYAFAYASALSRAGADMLSGGDSPAGLIGPRLYREIALPAERSLISKIKTVSRKPVSLHICGDATSILPSMNTTGADVLELDHAVGLSAACGQIDPEIAIWGNIDPISILARGTPERVTGEVHKVLATIKASGRGRFVLSSGCTLAMETPHANVRALIQAAQVHGG